MNLIIDLDKFKKYLEKNSIYVWEDVMKILPEIGVIYDNKLILIADDDVELDPIDGFIKFLKLLE